MDGPSVYLRVNAGSGLRHLAEGIIMLRIKCVNTKCTGKSFEWDEKRRLAQGGRVAAPHAEGAVRVVVSCSHCMTDNVVWLLRVQKNVRVARK